MGIKCKNAEHKSEARHKKMIPYGVSRVLVWCRGCDAYMVAPTEKHIKKAARQFNSRLIMRAEYDF